jgi:hypothetical protein
VSTVKVNIGAINRYFERRPLAGAGAPGLRGGQANAIAARMITFVIAEARKDFHTAGGPGRSGELITSFIPIIEPHPLGGTRVGVGSTAEHAKYLTEGTPRHSIPKRKSRYPLKSAKGHPKPLLGYPIFQVNHPGTKPNDFIRRGVNLAIGRPLP